MIHIKKFHKDIFNHLCKKCDRGFITLDGYTKHKLLHDKKAGKIVCDEEGCGSEFSMSDSYKNHKRKYHSVGGIKLQKCSYSQIGCVKHSRRNQTECSTRRDAHSTEKG